MSDTVHCLPFVESSIVELNFDLVVGLLAATGALLQQVAFAVKKIIGPVVFCRPPGMLANTYVGRVLMN